MRALSARLRWQIRGEGLVGLSVLGLLLLGAAVHAGERKSRLMTSANGDYTVHFVELTEGDEPPPAGEGEADAGVPPEPRPTPRPPSKKAAKPTCKVQVETDSGPAWAFPKCVGDPDDLFFVSNDGERIWVLHPLPKMPRGDKGWLGAKVATLIDRRDGVVRKRQLYEFVPRDGRDDVRMLESHVQWLEGMFGVPGVPPRLNKAGMLEFETAGGKKWVLPFR